MGIGNHTESMSETRSLYGSEVTKK